MSKRIEPTERFGNIDFIRHALKETKDVASVRRLQAVQFRMQGKTVSEVVSLLNVHRDTVHTWICKWNEGGLEALKTQPRPGRPRKLNAHYKNLTIEKIEGSLKDGKPYTAIAIHGYLKKK